MVTKSSVNRSGHWERGSFLFEVPDNCGRCNYKLNCGGDECIGPETGKHIVSHPYPNIKKYLNSSGRVTLANGLKGSSEG